MLSEIYIVRQTVLWVLSLMILCFNIQDTRTATQRSTKFYFHGKLEKREKEIHLTMCKF